MAQLVLLDHRELKVILAQLVPLAQSVQPVQQVPLEHKDYKVLQD